MPQVIGAPDPPGDEAVDFEFEDAADAFVTAEGGEGSLIFVDEGFGRFAANDGCDISADQAGFSQGVLGELGIGLAFGIGDGGAITEGPNAGMGFAAHGGIDCHAIFWVLFYRERSDEGIHSYAGGENDCVGIKGFGFSDMNFVVFDSFDAGIQADSYATVDEDFKGVFSEVFVHFRDEARAGFDQLKMH